MPMVHPIIPTLQRYIIPLSTLCNGTSHYPYSVLIPLSTLCSHPIIHTLFSSHYPHSVLIPLSTFCSLESPYLSTSATNISIGSSDSTQQRKAFRNRSDMRPKRAATTCKFGVKTQRSLAAGGSKFCHPASTADPYTILISRAHYKAKFFFLK